MSGIYYLQTRQLGIQIPYIADTELFNHIADMDTTQPYWIQPGIGDLYTAIDALNGQLIAMGLVARPTLTLDGSGGKDPKVINGLDAIAKIFPVRYVNSLSSSDYIGDYYACPTYKTTDSSSVISDLYTSGDSLSNIYGSYRVYSLGDPALYGTDISILIHVIPSTAISNGQIVYEHLGDIGASITIRVLGNGATQDYTAEIYASKTTSKPYNQSMLNALSIAPGADMDPYTGAGYPASTAPGGYSGGSFDFTDDPITGVHTPGLDLLNTGLITAWRPSKATLAQLASWLWTTTPGQIIQQLFGNPINAIIGLNIVPVSPPVDGGTNTIKFGNEDSHVACPKITNQHVTVDCGTLTIDPKYGSYMDFAPQTSAELFLPYVGGLPLDVNDVIGKTIGVKYQVDVLSGACVAYVFIDGMLHYQKAGGCAATAPITGSQMPNVVSGVLSIAGSVAGFVAAAGASGASTAAKVASGIAAGTSVAESAANMLKQSVSYSGTISGWAGLLGAQKPYLILSMPHAAIPGGQNTLMGYPAWVSGRVGDFTGYTECTVDRVTATRATDKEVEEIKSLLEGGVIL